MFIQWTLFSELFLNFKFVIYTKVPEIVSYELKPNFRCHAVCCYRISWQCFITPDVDLESPDRDYSVFRLIYCVCTRWDLFSMSVTLNLVSGRRNAVFRRFLLVYVTSFSCSGKILLASFSLPVSVNMKRFHSLKRRGFCRCQRMIH